MKSGLRKLLEMVRFSHTLFALPFALLSALLAWQEVPFCWTDLIGIILSMVTARSAAMAFNRLADRKFDALNPRTANRHLPSGELTPLGVRVFTGCCAAGFIVSTFIFLLSGNPWPAYLSLPVLLFIGAYSYAKRFTIMSHIWLGMALMMAPVATWIAIRGLQDLSTPIVLGLAVLFWVTGFDIIYACQDADFDRRADLFSVPAKFGIPFALRLAWVCQLLMIVCLILLGVLCSCLGGLYFIGVSGVALLLCYEHWLVRPYDLTRVNQAFFYVNGIISVGLLVVVALQLALGK